MIVSANGGRKELGGALFGSGVEPGNCLCTPVN